MGKTVPFLEGLVVGDDQRFAPVALVDDLVEQSRGFVVEGKIPT